MKWFRWPVGYLQPSAFKDKAAGERTEARLVQQPAKRQGQNPSGSVTFLPC